MIPTAILCCVFLYSPCFRKQTSPNTRTHPHTDTSAVSLVTGRPQGHGRFGQTAAVKPEQQRSGPHECFGFPVRVKVMFTLDSSEGFPGARTAKNLPSVQKTWTQPLGQQEPSGKGRQPAPVCLPGEFRGQRSLAGLWLMGSQSGA